MKIRAFPLLLALLAPGAAAAQDSTVAPRPAAIPAAQTTTPIEMDRIVAVVGSTPILLSDVFGEIAFRRGQGMPAPRDSAHLDSLMRQVVEELVNVELLVAEAARQGVEATDEELRPQVDRVVQNARQQAGSDERLREELQRAGLGTIEQWRRSLTDQARKKALQEGLLVRLRQEGKLPPAPVTEAEIAEAFGRLGTERPKRPATVGFRQIIVSPRPTEAAKAAARARADSIRAELAAGGDFAQIARRESMDGSAQLGGDLGWIRRGKTVPQFEQWAFNLPVGQISPVVETPFGFHIIRVDSRQPGEVKVRHILRMPAVDSADLARARVEADSVVRAWRAGASYDALLAQHHDPAEQSLVAEYQLAQLPETYQTRLRDVPVNTIVEPFDIDDPRSELPKIVVAQVTLQQPEGEYTLDDVRLQFRQQLGEKKAFDRYLAGLREQIFVDVRL